MTTHITSLTELLDRSMHDKRVEPEPRLVGGSFGYAFHRFPIKGGMTLVDAMAANMAEHNALLRLMMKRQKSKVEVN